MNNFRRRAEGEIKLVRTTYKISSVSNKEIVIVNPNNQLTVSSGSIHRPNNYKINPYICVTCDVVFTKTETYSNGSIKTSTLNASFTYTGASSGLGASPDYYCDPNGNITGLGSLSGSIPSPSFRGTEDYGKLMIIVTLVAPNDTIINTSSSVGTEGSGSFSVYVSGDPSFISNYNTRYSCGVVNTTLAKISDTTFLEVLSTE